MPRGRVQAILLVGLLLIVITYMASLAQPTSKSNGSIDLAERKAAADISFLEAPANGLPKHLSDLKGNIVVLDLWATWCGPCQMSIPDIVKMNKDLKGKPVRVIGVSMDQPETQNQIPDLAKKLDINYPIALGTKSAGIAAYETQGLPTLYIIDKQGRVAYVMQGYSPTFSVEDKVKEFLSEG